MCRMAGVVVHPCTVDCGLLLPVLWREGRSSKEKGEVPLTEFIDELFAVEEDVDSEAVVWTDKENVIARMKAERNWSVEKSSSVWHSYEFDAEINRDNKGYNDFPFRFQLPGNLFGASFVWHNMRIGQKRAVSNATKPKQVSEQTKRNFSMS